MNVIGDIMAPLRKYTDSSGDEKTAWGKCGVLMQNAEGQYRIKMDMVPIGSTDGWFSVFEKQERQPRQQGFRDKGADF